MNAGICFSAKKEQSLTWLHQDKCVISFLINRDGKILLLTNTSQHYVDISTVTPPDARDEYSLFLTTLDGSRISDKVLVTFSYGSNLKSDVECK